MRTSKAQRNRRVHFAEDGVRITVVERMEKTLWYSRNDLAKMKSTAKRECRQVNLDSTLGPAYGLPSKSDEDEDQLPSVVCFLLSSLSRHVFERLLTITFASFFLFLF